MSAAVWLIPLGTDLALIYAPFHGVTTLVNHAAAERVRSCLAAPGTPIPDGLEWISQLRQPRKVPMPHKGPPDPLYLGLIPTRVCGIECAYCDFAPPQERPVMDFSVIRQAIDGYAAVLHGKPNAEWRMHFFGGEPFAAFKEIVFAINDARRKAKELSIPTYFEVTTNGYYSAEKAHWIAAYFDCIVLSLDGFAPVQNRHRPGPGGRESFKTVCRSADIFSRSDCELIIRSCVSAENAGELEEWAAFIANRWAPSTVCLEPMIESPLARLHGLRSPNSQVFAENWTKAYRLLNASGIRLVYSSGDVNSTRRSLCPAGQDALIVTPDGRIGSCWQLEENQPAEGLDFGSVSANGMHIDGDLLDHQRQRSETNRARCRGCFCYAHCAGGCLLNREKDGDFCRLTRILTLWQLLERLGQGNLADRLLHDSIFVTRLAATADFSLEAAQFFPDGKKSAKFDNLSAAKPDEAADLPTRPADPVRGWLWDGDRIILAEPTADFFKVLTGDDALRFQLEHSGMTNTEISAVWTALREESC